MPDLLQIVVEKFNYICFVVLMQIGLFAMIVKRNLVKKLIGMSVFSTAIILFYVSVGVNNRADMLAGDGDKAQGGIPVLEHDLGQQAITRPEVVNPARYANPLPHVLMLTAIVVGVATLGVGLALVQRIHQDFGSLEEDEILKNLNGKEAGDE